MNLYEWIFDNGKQITYTPWNDGQPEHTDQSVIVMNSTKKGYWHDAKTTQTATYICEQDMFQ